MGLVIPVSAPYDGEDLGSHPHVALLSGQDQIGDFVVATPVMRGLRERFPRLTLDYLGGEGIRELEEASPLVDARYSLFGRPGGLEGLPSFLAERRSAAGPYDLAVNLETDPVAARACSLTEARYVVGPHLGSDEQMVLPERRGIDRLWHDVWNRPDLLKDYPELETQYIAEIFCRLARVETDYARPEVPISEPPGPVPPVLFATGARESTRLWPSAFWGEVAAWLRGAGLSAGLLGAAPRRQTSAFHAADADAAVLAAGVCDLRGQLALPEVAGALARARVFVTIDCGLLHLGAAARAPTIALFGASPRRLWAPPVLWVTILDPADPCTLCEENRFRNDACLLPVHQCMLSIPPSRVVAELQRLLGL